LKKGIEGSKALLASETDPEMRTYAQDELTQLETRIVVVEQELKDHAAAERPERRRRT